MYTTLYINKLIEVIMRLPYFVYLFISIIFCTSSLANAEEPPELPPLNPKYEAEHAMVLVNKGSSVYAINIPSFELPYDVHVMYKVDVSDIPFLDLVRDAELVTVKSKPFNIQRLMRGEEVAITADVYLGDFRQGGSLVYSDKLIELSEQLFTRELTDLSPASKWQQYDMVTLKNNERIYIHQITQPPSYHHIMFVDLSGACLQKFRTSTEVPSAGELNYKFINCGTLKPMFYDAESLSK